MKKAGLLAVIAIAVVMVFCYKPVKKFLWYMYRDTAYRLNTTHHDIVIFGDSHTYNANWKELLPGYDVIGKGIPGETVISYHKRIDNLVKTTPRICILQGGTNDVLQGVLADATIKAFALIADELKGKGIKLILFHVPYFNQSMEGSLLLNGKVDVLNMGIDSIAIATGATVLPLDALTARNGFLADEWSMPDGFHFNEAGYHVIAAAMEPILAQYTP